MQQRIIFFAENSRQSKILEKRKKPSHDLSKQNGSFKPSGNLKFLTVLYEHELLLFHFQSQVS